MSAPAIDRDHFNIPEIIAAIKSDADSAAAQARKEAEDKSISALRSRYGGKTLYCYDESHENRFHQEPRKWAAVALSFEGCVAKMRPHIIRYNGEDHWTVIEGRINDFRARKELPDIETGQRIVFQADNRWYCFFCIDGNKFCGKIVEMLAPERAENAHRANWFDGSCIIDI